MKKNKYIIFLAFLMLVGCTDVLDTTPSNEIPGGDMWTTEEKATQGMNAVYSALRTPIKSETDKTKPLYNSIVGAKADLGHYAWEIFGMTGQARLDVGNVFSRGVNASNPNFANTWKWCYTGANRATDAINNLSRAGMSEAKTQQYEAEARTLRAFFYMRLNELFGRGIGVPVYRTVPELTDYKVTQTPEAEVWDFIIDDLTKAIETDKNSFPNKTTAASGRVSKATAYALRGRAYLLSSQSLNVDRYQLAADDFEEVGKMGYTLYPDYAKLFTVAGENNDEYLLKVQNIQEPKADYSSGIQKYVAPWNAGGFNRGGCWTDFQITPAVVDLFEDFRNGSWEPFDWDVYIPGYNAANYNKRKVYFLRNTEKNGAEILSPITAEVKSILNQVPEYKAEYLAGGNEERLLKAYANRDPRLAASVITPYSNFEGVDVKSDGSPTTSVIYTSRWPNYGKLYAEAAQSESSMIPGMTTTLVANGNEYFYYMFRKFIGTGIEYVERDFAPIDEPIIRYADVLLMCAEAYVELDKLPEAEEKVAEVRNRVGMTTDGNKYFQDRATARNYVRDERRREFVCEGVNFFDEMRWKTLKATKFNYGPSTSMQVWGGVATGAPSYGWISDAWYTWPVPKADAEKNPNLKKTPGWTY